ncbi:MAG: hybrid sensor histidine kinase/response regulator [Desulfobacterales bacterium]|nr:hybrid sensor histidine kinase/response regulator [Desulfobacterales bacterium]
MDKRIIVIDDEASILDAFKEILKGSEQISGIDEIAALTDELSEEPPEKKTQVPGPDYELATALQGEDGYRTVTDAKNSGNPFSLAFIDIRMPPGWDGVKTARKIRKADPDIEIVIVTAYSDRKQNEIVKEVGRPEKLLYIRKPFDADEIRQLAQSLTRKWELEYISRKHRKHMEQLLCSMRRLKTLNVSSVRGVLAAILNEILSMINASKGIVFKSGEKETALEISSEDITQEQACLIKKKIYDSASAAEDVSFIDGNMVFPLKSGAGTYFILVCSPFLPVDEDKLKLLKLFTETASEVLTSVIQQGQSVKNERIATIGQVAAGIMHEINNPLSILSGLLQSGGLIKVQLAKLKISCPDNREQIDEIIKNFDIADMVTDQIVSVVNSMRGMSKTGDYYFRPQDISTALEDVLTMASNKLKYGITVYREWTGPLTCMCDMNSLKQVFLNLVLNAVQAMDGEGDLHISAMKKGDRIIISIKDSGPGIPYNEKDRIFSAFYTTKTDGTGLGLSIVKGIIEKHKGSIRVESELGRGTAFHIELASC